MCSCDQRLVTKHFLTDGLGSSSLIWNRTRYGLEMLHQCGKKVKTKSQIVVWANSYVCRSYRGKTGGWGLFATPSLPFKTRQKYN